MRPKKCYKCGGKKTTYQWGGGHENYYEPMSPDVPLVHNPADAAYFRNMQLQNPPQTGGKGISYEAVQSNPQFDLFDAGLAARAGTDILSEISGRVERGRQNQYMYNQYSTLGQMQGMPTQDYQPNPYSLYAKFGGSLRRYKNFDKRFSNDAHFGEGDEGIRGQMQNGGLTRGLKPPTNLNPEQLKAAAYWLERHTHNNNEGEYEGYPGTFNLHNIVVGNPFGGPNHPQDYADVNHGGANIPIQNWGNYSLNLNDAKTVNRMLYNQPMLTTLANGFRSVPDNISAGVMNSQQIQGELQRPLIMPPDMIRKKSKYSTPPSGVEVVKALGGEMKSGGKWIQKAINPAHKGYCTPMTKSTCTGHRRALALLFKKKHGFHKGK